MLKSILLAISAGAMALAPLAAASQSKLQPAAQAPAGTTPAPAAGNSQTGPALPAVPPGGMALDTKNPIKPTAESQARAKQIYSFDCAMCHGDNGNGKTDLAASMGLTLTDLTSPKTLADRKDGELFNLIRNGKDKMPGEDKARASDDEVWNLVLYIRKLAKPKELSVEEK